VTAATTMPLALTGGLVVTSLSPPSVVRADVLVEAGRVASVGDEGGGAPGSERIDAAGCLVIPGNVCAHHHLYSALARGMPYRLAPPEDFVQVLRRVWWRLDRALDADTVWASAWAGGAGALLAGTTTIVDHHASPNAIEGSLEAIAGALADLGARSVLCYEVTDRDGARRAGAGIEENRRFLKETSFPLARGMVGAHASFTLSPDTLAACVDAASDAGAGIHVHVAEDAADQADALDRFGIRVVERLDRAGALDERSLLAHCIHLDPAERDLVAERGATAVHNPRSNMNNRVGRIASAGFERLALGTDGIDGDMFAESRAAFWRAREADGTVGPGWILDRLAGSARFAGAIFDEPMLGRIERGAPADLVVLDYDPPTPVTGDNFGGHWVFGLSAGHVRDVVVAGTTVVRDRRLTRVDPAATLDRCRGLAKRLWRRMDDIEEHPFHP
jgi:putative selenium metabolism protein SsnA